MGEYTKRRFRTHRFTTRNGEELRIRGKSTGECEIHDWPTDGLAPRLVQAMKDRHPKGINACTGCIERSVQDRRSMSELDPELLKLIEDTHGPLGAPCRGCGGEVRDVLPLCGCFPESYPLSEVIIRGPETFIERVLAGLVVDVDVELDDHIDRWHESSGSESLCQALGFSRDEYARWLIEPNVLPVLLQAYRMGIGELS